MKRSRGERDGPKLYTGVIWIGDQPGRRVSVWAEAPLAAREKVEVEYGKGHPLTLHNEGDAERPR